MSISELSTKTSHTTHQSAKKIFFNIKEVELFEVKKSIRESSCLRFWVLRTLLEFPSNWLSWNWLNLTAVMVTESLSHIKYWHQTDLYLQNCQRFCSSSGNPQKKDGHGVGVTVGLGSTARVVGTLTETLGGWLSVENGDNLTPHTSTKFL